ncbi:MAG: hypothetical protein H6633_05545 [Anaerolineales bacterium]|nr:hypothetical protein [Anaerolineales bacterium]
MIELLIIGAVALLVIAAITAPLESLGWWAGWFGEDVNDGDPVHLFSQTALQTDEAGKNYIVYLSGIGALTGSSIPKEELPFLDAVAEKMPGTVIIKDVFPYSVTNAGLTGERVFSWVWRKIEAQRVINPNAASLYLIVIRNLFQVAVSADQRYGPVYNVGVAKEIWRSLLRHGYHPGSDTPVTLMGTSGGGQVSAGVATYLAAMVNAPLRAISLGGVISADPGLLKLDHLYHLYGTKDSTQALGYKVFPGRWNWPFSQNSPWFRAERAGKITMIELGPFTHTGADSPFDQNSKLPDGQRHFDKTLEVVTEIVGTFYHVPPQPNQPVNGLQHIGQKDQA